EVAHLLVDLEVDLDAARHAIRCLGRVTHWRGPKGLLDALDPDEFSIRDRVGGLGLGEGRGVGLMKLHVVDLDEEVFVGRVGTLPPRWVRVDAVPGHVDAEGEVDVVVTVEVDATRLPAVGESVAVRVDDDSGVLIETPGSGNGAGRAPRNGSRESGRER